MHPGRPGQWGSGRPVRRTDRRHGTPVAMPHRQQEHPCRKARRACMFTGEQHRMGDTHDAVPRPLAGLGRCNSSGILYRVSHLSLPTIKPLRQLWQPVAKRFRPRRTKPRETRVRRSPKPTRSGSPRASGPAKRRSRIVRWQSGPQPRASAMQAGRRSLAPACHSSWFAEMTPANATGDIMQHDVGVAKYPFASAASANNMCMGNNRSAFEHGRRARRKYRRGDRETCGAGPAPGGFRFRRLRSAAVPRGCAAVPLSAQTHP